MVFQHRTQWHERSRRAAAYHHDNAHIISSLRRYTDEAHSAHYVTVLLNSTFSTNASAVMVEPSPTYTNPESDTTRVRESRERDSMPHTARARRADCRRRPRPEACGRLMARLNERRRSRRGVHVRRAASSILPLPSLSHDSMPHTARACRADCRRRPRPEACGRLMARLNARRRCRRGVHVFRAASSLQL